MGASPSPERLFQSGVQPSPGPRGSGGRWPGGAGTTTRFRRGSALPPLPARSQNSPSRAPAVRQTSRGAAGTSPPVPATVTPPVGRRGAHRARRSAGHAPPTGVHSPPPAGLAPPVPRWTRGGPWASDVFPDGRLRARQAPVWMKLPPPLSDGTPPGRWTGRECACVRAKSLQSCPTLCNPMDHSRPGSSVRDISQARMLEWVAMPSSRGSARPRDQTCVSYASRVGRRVLYC